MRTNTLVAYTLRDIFPLYKIRVKERYTQNQDLGNHDVGLLYISRTAKPQKNKQFNIERMMSTLSDKCRRKGLLIPPPRLFSMGYNILNQLISVLLSAATIAHSAPTGPAHTNNITRGKINQYLQDHLSFLTINHSLQKCHVDKPVLVIAQSGLYLLRSKNYHHPKGQF